MKGRHIYYYFFSQEAFEAFEAFVGLMHAIACCPKFMQAYEGFKS